MGVIQTSGNKKKIIIDTLLQSEMVRKLINPSPHADLDEREVLLGGEWVIDGNVVKEQGHIFDYNFVDDTVTDSKVFIFVETDIGNVYNKFANYSLFIHVFAEKPLVRLSANSTPTKQEMKDAGFEGNRIDILCGVIDNLLNGRDIKDVGNLEPAPMGYMRVYQPNRQFYGKCLTYTVKSYDDGGDKCGLQ